MFELVLTCNKQKLKLKIIKTLCAYCSLLQVDIYVYVYVAVEDQLGLDFHKLSY